MRPLCAHNVGRIDSKRRKLHNSNILNHPIFSPPTFCRLILKWVWRHYCKRRHPLFHIIKVDDGSWRRRKEWAPGVEQPAGSMVYLGERDTVMVFLWHTELGYIVVRIFAGSPRAITAGWRCCVASAAGSYFLCDFPLLGKNNDSLLLGGAHEKSLWCGEIHAEYMKEGSSSLIRIILFVFLSTVILSR